MTRHPEHRSRGERRPSARPRSEPIAESAPDTVEMPVPAVDPAEVPVRPVPAVDPAEASAEPDARMTSAPRPQPRPRPDGVPLIPERSRDDSDAGWNDGPDSNDERLRRDVPPHW